MYLCGVIKVVENVGMVQRVCACVVEIVCAATRGGCCSAERVGDWWRGHVLEIICM